MIGIAQDPPAEYPFIRDTPGRWPPARAAGRRRAARLPNSPDPPGGVQSRARASEVAARGARASADPHARTGVVPPTSGSL